MLTPKKSIQSLEPYVGPRSGRLNCMRLDFNENPYGPSPKVMEALQAISREECGCYPEYAQLNRALSDYFGVAPECVLAANGGDEGIRAIFDTYVDKGEQVILLSPDYSMYELYAQAAGACIVRISCFSDSFVFPIEQIMEAITPRTRLLALSNPNNPCGALIARENIVKIAAAHPHMAVLLDEAYAPYARTTHVDLLARYSNLLFVQTFSKAFGLAGLRLGCVLSAKENIAALSKTVVPAYSVDIFAAKAAVAAMQDREYVEACVDETICVREQFIEELKALGLAAVPSSANFVLVRFGDDAACLQELLSQQSILVRHKHGLEGYLRITIGTRSQMQQLLDLMKQFYERKTALIFDMDGVLIDESASYRPCIAQTVAYFSGRKIELQEVQQWKRMGGYNNDYECAEAMLARMGCTVQRDKLVKQFDTFYHSMFKHAETWLVDESLLRQLKKRFKLAIFTGRPRRDALDALQRFGKQGLFEIVVADEDVQKKKPHPEGLLQAMAFLQAEQALYFGDSVDDKEAARRASVEFVEVVSNGSCQEQLIERFI